MTRITHVLALVFVILFACTAGLSACAPANEAVLASTPEPTLAATQTATPTPSPSPTPTPEPYFDLENMTDEELLSVYGIPIEGTLIIGYAFDNNGLWIVEYIADETKCITIVGSDSTGKKTTFSDYPMWIYKQKILMTVDTQSCIEAENSTWDGILNHDQIFYVNPYPGELFIGENEVKNVIITRTMSLSFFYRYLELQGLIVPETEWSQDIEGLDMLGNVVSIIGQLRYFLTVAPHDEVMNHIKLNYPETAKIIMEVP